jgi:hypothetical protein
MPTVPRQRQERELPYQLDLRILHISGRTALIMVAATLGLMQTARAQGCRPEDSTSATTTKVLKDYVTSTDSFTVRMRNGIGIAGTPANQISYNPRSATCRSAVTALNAHFGTPGVARTVYVWLVGSNYVVEDPANQQTGAYRAVYLFTSKWVFKGSWGPN